MCLSGNMSTTASTSTTSSSTTSTPSTSVTTPSSASDVRSRLSTENGDELGPSDEVKVFKDEGEDEGDGNGSESLQAELLEEKSSLIIESEQGKPDLRYKSNPFAVPGRFFDPNSPFGVPPYLVSPYAAAYANGLANGSHLPRSPFLYAGDPLSSPPPAHMGVYLDKTAAAAVGLRPPIYPLSHSQYPYSMLGADQLAAWHHQASMYQAGALRSASPYSLPITSTGLTSPMSRFSPTGLLSHPGLSPAGLSPASNGGTVSSSGLPVSSGGSHIKSERDVSSSSSGVANNRNHSEKSSPTKQNKKSKEPHIKKPLNAFMLYMKEMRPVVQSECTLKESAAINQILGRRWHGLTREEQAKYYEKSRMERQKHMQMYPHWNARDNYRFGLKKKKRKRDKADDPAGGMKKCRARYGLDQQDLWCKPCRRKKKCIRVQAYLDGRNASSSSTSANNNNNNKDADDNNMHSDGEDNDEEDDDDYDDLESRSGSLDTVSEPSLTSPAGFSSLPSLGSPASIASPLTPGDNSADWLRIGAFKPPPNHLHGYHSSFLHNNHVQRIPVGTDPRDSKNPLSVSQLTSNHGSPVLLPPPPPSTSATAHHHHHLHHNTNDKRLPPLLTMT